MTRIEDNATAKPAPRTPLRREPPPKWRSWIALPILYVLLLPLAKLLELFGLWPRIMARGMLTMMRRVPKPVPTAHDVLVCSYFKSGTNWTMQIAVQIAFRGRAEFAHIHDLVPWIDIPERYGYAVPADDDGPRRAAPTGLRVIKTHLTLDDVAYSPEAKYVWVVRDPKDVFVSSYHFVRSISLGPLMPTLGHWLDNFLSPDAYLGSWAKHLQDGWQRRDLPNVLFLTYEEMKADLRGAVVRIAKLMDVDLTPAELELVVAQSSYAHMKTIAAKFETTGISPPWARPRGAMIRRGERGASSELLTPAQQRRIDDYWRAELERLGSDFPYDRAFKTAGPLVPKAELQTR